MQPGTKIGNLQVGLLAHADAAGEVYHATVDPSQLRALVRVLNPSLTSDPAFLRVTLDALTRFGATRHPNLAQMVPVDLTGTTGRWLIVNALGNADPLPELLSRDTLTAADAVQAFQHVVAGLRSVHAMGLFHGDIRPENVVISSDGKGKLAGFAFAGIPAADRDARRAYQAPEALASGKPSASADLFALGVTFRNVFRMLGGAPAGILGLAERMASPDVARRPDDLNSVHAELTKRCTITPSALAPEIAHEPPPIPMAAPEAAPAPVATRSSTNSNIPSPGLSPAARPNPTNYRPAFPQAPQNAPGKWEARRERSERTQTLQIQLETEIRASIRRERMPKPFTIAIFAGLAIAFYVEIWPMIQQKGLSRTIASAREESTKFVQQFSGAKKMKELTGMSLDVKKTAEDHDVRTTVSADAAANGDATAPPEADTEKK
jgi:serine/threonine protein kinase